MSLLLRICALVLVALVCALLLKGSVPPLALLLSAGTVGAVLLLLGDGAADVLGLARETAEETGLSEELFVPVVKTVVIALITRFTGALCKDAGESAMAAAVDFAGTVLALIVMFPLLRLLLEVLKELLA